MIASLPVGKRENGMAQRFPRMLVGTLAAALLASTAAWAGEGELRVCADPDNLPFSNQRQAGFENKIAKRLADDLRMRLVYTWQKQRQSFIRQTLLAERCDVVMGVPYGLERVRSTRPYYRSGYVFVTARRRHLALKSLDDPLLRTLKIGLHAIGKDGSNTPPANALARRGMAANIVGFSMWGEASVKNPQGQIVDAVAQGQIDAAIVWGPIGGFFANRYGKALVVEPVPDDAGMPSMPFAFDIAIGVRKGEEAFAAQLEASVQRNRREIHDILTAYHIPLIEPVTGSPSSESDTGRTAPQTQ